MNNDNVNQEIKLVDKKNLFITGVKKIISFDEEEFLLDTNLGYILIKGLELDILKLDTHDGILIIKGVIISFSYIDDVDKKKNSLFEKLFK